MTVWVAHLGRRFDILQALARGRRPMSPAGLAAECGLYEPAVRAWCRAAFALRVIERNGELYRLPNSTRRLLVSEDSNDYIGGQFSYLALRSLDFGAFDELFKKGRVARGAATHLAEASGEATKWDHTAFVRLVLPRFPRLRSLLARGARVLDLGCGAGEWDLRVAQRFPKSSFVGIDPDRRAVARARGTATELRLGARVRFAQGRGESLAYREAFDVVYLGEVLYALSAKRKVLSNCRRALRAGGFLVVAEGLLEAQTNSRNPTNQLLSAMNLEYTLQGAGFLSKHELRELLQEGGLRGSQFFHAGGGLWFVVSRK